MKKPIFFSSFSGDSAQLSSVLKEHCSGWCNLFHVLGALGKPADPTPTSQGEKRGVAARTTPRGGMLREIMKQAMALASGSTPPPPSMGEAEFECCLVMYY